MTEEKLVQKQLRIVRNIPDDLQSFFIDHVVVQHDQEKFILTFYELFPPLYVQEGDIDLSKFNELDSVEAKCVARIVVTPKRMEQFYKALTNNIEKFKKLPEETPIDISELLDEEE